MKNDARKMALENQIELAQQNAIDFTHACMTIALHDVFGVGKDRLDKVTQRKDEINGELMRRMAIPAKNQKAQLNEAEKWLVGLLPEGVVSVFRVPVIKGVPRKRREVSRKRVPCVLPLSEAEVQRRVEAVTSSVHSSPEMSTVLSRRRI